MKILGIDSSGLAAADRVNVRWHCDGRVSDTQ